MKANKLISNLQENKIHYISVKLSPELLSIIKTFQDNLVFNCDGFKCEFEDEHEYVSLFIDDGELTIMNVSYVDTSDDDLLVDEKDFISCLLYVVREKNITQHIKLNNEYEAICNTSGIKVGCQKFDWDIVDKLVKAKKEILKK